MNFNTANQTFRQLLGNGLSYRVPTFQRDYSWTETEWDDLWQDLIGLFEPDGELSHYMGYLVLQSSDSRVFDVIDGQQRITTLSLLVLATMKHLQDLIAKGVESEDNARRLEQLRSSYIGYLDVRTLVTQSKLQLNRHNDKFYQTYLVPLQRAPKVGLNVSERLLRKAFDWFHEKIRDHCGSSEGSGHKAATFVDELVDRIFFTIITVTDELNAFKVFETLNARGVRLSTTDLLKNFLFSMVHASDLHNTQLKAMENQWERIVDLLGSESFPEFLRVFWNSRNRLARKTELFKAVRLSIADDATAFRLLRDLDQSAATYSALRNPQDSSWSREEQKALEALQLFGVRQPLAMLLACHARFFESDRRAFTRILRAIEIFTFRYNTICNRQPRDQERLYNAIARKVTDGALSAAADVIGGIQPLYPDDDEFKAAFSRREFRTTNTRSKRIARHILFALERQASGQALDAESATYTLEHILPENPGADWAHIGESQQEALTYRLGNMTLLKSRENRDLGNTSYATKHEVYAKSPLAITQAVAEHYETWDAGTLDARQQRLAATATAIWRLSF